MLRRYRSIPARRAATCPGALKKIPPTGANPRPTSEFLTRKLWDVANSDPFGHRGDLTTLTEAIYFHGGDARVERDAFFSLSQASQDAIIEFLKTLQVLPEQRPRRHFDDDD